MITTRTENIVKECKLYFLICKHAAGMIEDFFWLDKEGEGGGRA